MDKLLDLLPLGLAGLALFGCRLVRPLSAHYEDALSREVCVPLRGWMALLVLLHHIAQQTESGRLLRSFLYLGQLPVSVFFFLSGYGLMRAAMTKRDYGDRFLQRHLLPLLAQLLAVLGLFRLVYAALGEFPEPFALLRLIFTGDPILVILWYLPVLGLFYLAAGLCLRLFPGRPGALLAVTAGFCLLYQGLCLALSVGQWWFNTCELLPFGMAWALYEDRLRLTLSRFWWPAAAGLALLFVLLYQFFDPLFALRPTAAARFLLLSLRNISFGLLVAALMYKFHLKGRLLRFLGGISLELYTTQGLALLLFHSGRFAIDNEFVYALAVLLGTATLAAALHPLHVSLKKRIG